MTVWLFAARDPLVIRDGRPNEGQSESASLPFPYPSTMAGLVRTRLGSGDDGSFQLEPAQIDQLLAAPIRGPLPYMVSGNMLYATAPLDCLIVQEVGGRKECRALHPIKMPEGALMDKQGPLQPVGLEAEELISGKAPRDLPVFWPWELLEGWLSNPGDFEHRRIFETGLGSFPMETRVHVAIGPEGIARDSMLFSTTGIRFLANRGVKNPENRNIEVQLFVDVGQCNIDGQTRCIQPGMAPAGGERRLCRWIEAPGIRLPEPPTALLKHLKKPIEEVRVRVVLLTPAVFEMGALPAEDRTNFASSRQGLDVRIVAARIPRPRTISGWDFRARQPKATRRLVAAGSVYWLDLAGSPAARVEWLNRVWMQNISDGEQDCRDGFGLAVVGVA